MTREDVYDILSFAPKAQVDRFIRDTERESEAEGKHPGECWYHPFCSRSAANDYEIVSMFQQWIAGV
jgi:hypothetical protein